MRDSPLRYRDQLDDQMPVGSFWGACGKLVGSLWGASGKPLGGFAPFWGRFPTILLKPSNLPSLLLVSHVFSQLLFPFPHSLLLSLPPTLLHSIQALPSSDFTHLSSSPFKPPLSLKKLVLG